MIATRNDDKHAAITAENPLGLTGIEFVELSGPDPHAVGRLLRDMGFSRLMAHSARRVDYWRQNDIHMLVNTQPGSFAAAFQAAHGPCISAMGWRVVDAEHALAAALERGAVRAEVCDYDRDGEPLPAIVGIGGSLVYFVEDGAPSDAEARYGELGFVPLEDPTRVPELGFLTIDHLTNNVPKGEMGRWADFYKGVFGFTEVRYFDIRGVKTGLQSYALRSPCGTFCIPINEGTEEASQISEYLREYNGPGVQHLAFLTKDIIASLHGLHARGHVETLDIDAEYYAQVFDRVPNVREDKAEIERLKILVDGDEAGYLLQIFTKNVLGPIFIEIIQRENHFSFGEGNFGALFRSIERDQEARGVLA
ncbi:MAG: 4-hydroxyphenylpyruvate dioxygenase [Myxococcales bacterium]|nr:4-hydroxyphenylpyruvate dioxygenase [Myxococcales bacterium]MCB9736548.1 4-hydroxyphenylpyruvate dioxygenase [Deltaproteobacteria bacterium]